MYGQLKVDRALVFLCRAADQNHAGAQRQIGLIYAHGIHGITPKPALAYMWFSLSVVNGYERSTRHADWMFTKLTDMEKNSAQRLLTDWQPGQCEREFASTGFGN